MYLHELIHNYLTTLHKGGKALGLCKRLTPGVDSPTLSG